LDHKTSIAASSKINVVENYDEVEVFIYLPFFYQNQKVYFFYFSKSNS